MVSALEAGKVTSVLYVAKDFEETKKAACATFFR